jgi:uncharacterized tellurite resistance protein B-like protein
MERLENILEGYTDQEKGAYLGAIASIATTDHEATQEELEYLTALSEAMELSPVQEATVVRAASQLTSCELKKCLDVLKNSSLKYSLVADIITFAKVDGRYTEQEKSNIQKIAEYLNVNHNQFSLLDQFVSETAQKTRELEQVREPGFFEKIGLKALFENAGIQVSALSKGLLGMVGPTMLSGMISRVLRRRSGMVQTNGTLGMAMPGKAFGGFGSIFSMINRNGSYRGTGGLLGKLHVS